MTTAPTYTIAELSDANSHREEQREKYHRIIRRLIFRQSLTDADQREFVLLAIKLNAPEGYSEAIRGKVGKRENAIRQLPQEQEARARLDNVNARIIAFNQKREQSQRAMLKEWTSTLYDREYPSSNEHGNRRELTKSLYARFDLEEADLTKQRDDTVKEVRRLWERRDPAFTERLQLCERHIEILGRELAEFLTPDADPEPVAA